jgi:hypothetical protein
MLEETYTWVGAGRAQSKWKEEGSNNVNHNLSQAH